jgi:hypothetical protein
MIIGVVPGEGRKPPMTTSTARAPKVHELGRAPRAIPEIVTKYRGAMTVRSPSTGDDPLAHDYVAIICDHLHDDRAEAEACGKRAGAAAARDMNAELARAYADVPCEVTAWRSPAAGDRAPVWFKACLPHHAADHRARFSEDDALALAWECPWAGLAPAAEGS